MMKSKLFCLTLILFSQHAYSDFGLRIGKTYQQGARVEFEDRTISKATSGDGFSVLLFTHKQDSNIQLSVGYLQEEYTDKNSQSLVDKSTIYGVNFLFPSSDNYGFEINPNLALGSIFDKTTSDSLMSWRGISVRAGPYFKISDLVSVHFYYQSSLSLTEFDYSSQRLALDFGIWF